MSLFTLFLTNMHLSSQNSFLMALTVTPGSLLLSGLSDLFVAVLKISTGSLTLLMLLLH